MKSLIKHHIISFIHKYLTVLAKINSQPKTLAYLDEEENDFFILFIQELILIF